MNFKHLEKPFPIYDEDYASVAILINSKKEILYIKRSDNLPTHKGDIAFPGGKKEESDSDIVTTALREVQEELFLNPSTIHPFGVLDPVDTVEYKFKVFPIVCESFDKPTKINKDEVQDFYLLDISDLDNLNNWEFRGNYDNDWIFKFDDQILWGATAHMTRNLLNLNLG